MLKYLTVSFRGKEKLHKPGIHHLVSDVGTALNLKFSSLIVNFVTEQDIIDLNIRFLRHDYPTDIITFDYAGRGESIDGELFISYKEAELNAEKYGVTAEEELTRLIIHGILHLAGFNDKKRGEKIVMKRIENRLLRNFKHHLVK